MKIYISSVTEIKRGKNKLGRNWTLYRVTEPDGKTYSTFEDKYASMVGMEIDVQVEEKVSEVINKKTGKPFVNLSIVEARAERKSPQGNYVTQEDLRLFKMYFEGELEKIRDEIKMSSKPIPEGEELPLPF